jgi:hypothetical protein
MPNGNNTTYPEIAQDPTFVPGWVPRATLVPYNRGGLVTPPAAPGIQYFANGGEVKPKYLSPQQASLLVANEPETTPWAQPEGLKVPAPSEPAQQPQQQQAPTPEEPKPPLMAPPAEKPYTPPGFKEDKPEGKKSEEKPYTPPGFKEDKPEEKKPEEKQLEEKPYTPPGFKAEAPQGPTTAEPHPAVPSPVPAPPPEGPQPATLDKSLTIPTPTPAGPTTTEAPPLAIPTPTPESPTAPDPHALVQNLIAQGHSPGEAQAIAAGRQPKTLSGAQPKPKPSPQPQPEKPAVPSDIRNTPQDPDPDPGSAEAIRRQALVTQKAPLPEPQPEQGSKALDYSDIIAQTVGGMPKGGKYSTSPESFNQLKNSITKNPDGTLHIDTSHTTQSFCSAATYQAFLSSIEALAKQGKIKLDPDTVQALSVMGQKDGQGVWGRWNANGPGTAKLFAETGMGTNFTDISKAKPGDFLKIFWNDKVGAGEHGHSVVYMGQGQDAQGNPTLKFWSANNKGGMGVEEVPMSRVNGTLFSRLTHPENINNITKISGVDPYLSGLQTKSSTRAEMMSQTGASEAPVPAPGATVGRQVQEGTKLSGMSTIFGLNYDGSIDKQDNGRGFFGNVNTRNPDVKGVAVPIDVLEKTFGTFTKLNSKGGYDLLDTPEAHKIYDMIRSSHVELVGKDGKIHQFPIVDIQGTLRFHPNHVLDLTYGAAKEMGFNDNTNVSY